MLMPVQIATRAICSSRRQGELALGQKGTQGVLATAKAAAPAVSVT
jgi:hypothetical protein